MFLENDVLIGHFQVIEDSVINDFILDDCIDEDFLLEETIGHIQKPKVYCVYINSNDNGTIDHFHMNAGKNTNRNIENVCIRISSNEYFIHGNHNTGTLNKNMCKALDDFLRQSAKIELQKKYKVKTNWEVIRAVWNANSERGTYVDEYIVQPDYSKINIAKRVK